MAKLTIVADIRVKPEHVVEIKAGLQALIAPTLAESGCLQYDLHVDNEDPNHFLFYENWESRDLWQNHMETEHIKAFQTLSDGKIAEVAQYKMAHLDRGAPSPEEKK